MNIYKSIACTMFLLTAIGCDFSTTPPALQQKLEKIANRFNELSKADANQEGPRLTRTTAGPGRLLTFEHSVQEYSRADLDSEKLKTVVATLKDQYLAMAKSKKLLQELAAQDVELKYIFTGRDGSELFQFTLSPNEYRQ